MNEGTPGTRSNYVERASTRVIVCTPTATFEGTFHYPMGARLSDAIRMAFTSDHLFLLTDVEVSSSPALAEPASRASFVCINEAHVTAVIPVEEPIATEAGDASEPPARSLKDFAT